MGWIGVQDRGAGEVSGDGANSASNEVTDAYVSSSGGANGWPTKAPTMRHKVDGLSNDGAHYASDKGASRASDGIASGARFHIEAPVVSRPAKP